jgi:hypothetical protein
MIYADDNEQKFVNKKAQTMFDNPVKYAKEKLKSKKFKQAKKALKNIEDINIKLPRKKNLYPAISIANWSGAILHINMGTAPFKYSDPMFKDGIFQIDEKNLTQDMNGKFFLLKKRSWRSCPWWKLLWELSGPRDRPRFTSKRRLVRGNNPVFFKIG